MGRTARTTIRIGAKRFEGEALLETSELLIRGEKRLRVPFSEMKDLEAKDGALTFRYKSEPVEIADAAKWLDSIRNPKTVVEKLGVKHGQRVALIALDDDAFARDIEARGASLSRGRAAKNCDAIFYGANTRADLAKLAKLRDSLAPNGALWVIRPKGVKDITESEVMAAGKAAGLVDVKVVRFSDTHTAEKFVIPVSSRR